MTSPEVYKERYRKARKAHRCCECGRERIRPSDTYLYASGVWDGQGASFKVCLRCARARRMVVAHDMSMFWGILSPAWCAEVLEFGSLRNALRETRHTRMRARIARTKKKEASGA